MLLIAPRSRTNGKHLPLTSSPPALAFDGQSVQAPEPTGGTQAGRIQFVASSWPVASLLQAQLARASQPSFGLFYFLIFKVYIFFVCLFFWPHHATCRILVPRPGMESGPPAVEARSPNHWTTREFPFGPFLNGSHLAMALWRGETQPPIPPGSSLPRWFCTLEMRMGSKCHSGVICPHAPC